MIKMNLTVKSMNLRNNHNREINKIKQLKLVKKILAEEFFIHKYSKIGFFNFFFQIKFFSDFFMMRTLVEHNWRLFFFFFSDLNP